MRGAYQRTSKQPFGKVLLENGATAKSHTYGGIVDSLP